MVTLSYFRLRMLLERRNVRKRHTAWRKRIVVLQRCVGVLMVVVAVPASLLWDVADDNLGVGVLFLAFGLMFITAKKPVWEDPGL